MEQKRYDNKDRILTEDVSLYLVAITDNTYRNSLKMISDGYPYQQIENKNRRALDDEMHERSLRTLDAIKTRAWKESGH